MIAGFAAGLVGSNGNFDVAWDGMRSGAVSGGIQAGIFSTIGDAAHAAQVAGTWKHSAMHAFGGGVSSAVQGGEFWQGAVSQGITHYSGTMTNINNLLGDSFAGQTTMQAIMGGSISSLSGGNFQNAATTAAFAHMFNELQHRVWTYSQSGGTMSGPDGMSFNGLYSGMGDGQNDPDEQHVRNVGPIPRGEWQVAGYRQTLNGYAHADVVVLRALNVNSSRDLNSFLIHGGNGDGTASSGCIILNGDANRRKFLVGDRIMVIR